MVPYFSGTFSLNAPWETERQEKASQGEREIQGHLGPLSSSSFPGVASGLWGAA